MGRKEADIAEPSPSSERLTASLWGKHVLRHAAGSFGRLPEAREDTAARQGFRSGRFRTVEGA
jgi:hypothetical protein